MAAWLLWSGVAMCVDTCGLATSCCKMHCDGCMNIAWGLCWGGSRSTKPCVFPCKVAAVGDERYLVRAAGAAAGRFAFLFCRAVTVASSCFRCVCAYFVIGCFGICGCRSQWNGHMIVVTFCCHVCGDMRLFHEMLENALSWLHQGSLLLEWLFA